MSSRCELTDLYVEQCSHCVRRSTPISVDRVKTASFESGCSRCMGRIQIGELIGLVEGEWVCSACRADRSGR